MLYSCCFSLLPLTLAHHPLSLLSSDTCILYSLLTPTCCRPPMVHVGEQCLLIGHILGSQKDMQRRRVWGLRTEKPVMMDGPWLCLCCRAAHDRHSDNVQRLQAPRRHSWWRRAQRHKLWRRGRRHVNLAINTSWRRDVLTRRHDMWRRLQVKNANRFRKDLNVRIF